MGDRELRTETGNLLVKPVSEGAGRDAPLSTLGARGVFAPRDVEHQHVCAKIPPSLVTDAGEVEEREESSDQKRYFGKRSQR